jgi:sugar phosphate isomerase/epimerase
MDYTPVVSAFGDEIEDDLAAQLDVLASLDVHALELRSAWGANVLDLDAGQLKTARQLLDARGFSVSAVGSPIGKSRIDQPREFELERMQRAARAADALGTRLVRVFSFYRPESAPDAPWSAYRDEVLARMALLTERAQRLGLSLVHENERDIYGDVPERCLDIHQAVPSPALRNAFDPANYVLCGVKPMIDAWPLLADHTAHIHVKDARFADGSIQPAGAGDGDIPGLLAALKARGYQGFLTLEPHLKHAGQFGGLSGPDGMRIAAEALKNLMA